MFRGSAFQVLSMVALTCGAACARNAVRPSLTLDGQWGGEHVVLTSSESATHLEFDCAHGDLSSRIKTDSQHRFNLAGTFVRERGGPVRRDAAVDSHSASYEGSVLADTMTLTVRLTDSGEPIGTFTLEHGVAGRLVKCRQPS
jgi:hypothetical protein